MALLLMGPFPRLRPRLVPSVQGLKDLLERDFGLGLGVFHLTHA